MNIARVLDFLRDKEVRLNITEDISFSGGEYILIKNTKDLFVAKVLEVPRKVPHIKNENDMVFQRRLTPIEVTKFDALQENQQERVREAQKLANKIGLKMRFFASRIGWGERMISFFFTSPNPVDFRELLKVMIPAFRGRIHLQRVSDRQRAQIIGGVGPCGRVDCCQFLRFNNKKVSLDAVRDQGIMINHNSKIFGVHNKIKTCYLYELGEYRKNRKYLPHIKQSVQVKGQKGRVIGVDILNRRVKVFLENETIEVFPVESVEYENKKEAPPIPELDFKSYEVGIEGVGIEDL